MVRVTTDVHESMPLAQVSESNRLAVVEKKVWRLRSLFETDLRVAFEYLDDLRTHEAWKYLREPDLDRMIENRCYVTPVFLQQLRSGYASLIAAGQTGKITATQAHAASVAEIAHQAVAIARHGEIGGGHSRDSVGLSAKGSENSSAYLTARIARDRPDVLERMKRGEFRSVRAAAIEAGIIDPVRQLEAQATRATRRLDDEALQRLEAIIAERRKQLRLAKEQP